MSPMMRAMIVLLFSLPGVAHPEAPSASPQSFTTAQQAAASFVAAAQADDTAALLSILGPQAKDLLDTGDAVADNKHRASFSRALESGWKLAADPVRAGTFVLLVGEKEWPFPIPIVESHGRWRYDTVEGRKEILARLIGDNEITAIEICRAYVEAQQEYASAKRDGVELHQYAQHIVSSPGAMDGLYWPASANEQDSPAGEIFARMSAEGYTEQKGKPKDLSGLPVPHSQKTGRPRTGRSTRLRGQGPYDRRVWTRRLPSCLRCNRHHHVHREPGRHRI